jgi:hypothetical protein
VLQGVTAYCSLPDHVGADLETLRDYAG